MSDINGMPDESGPDSSGPGGPPEQKSLWDRYRTAPVWARVAIPAGIVVVLIGIGLIIANAVGGGSSTTSATTTTAPKSTDVLLLAVAKELTTSTTTTTTTEPTTQETTTTEATTTAPPTTTTVLATTVAPSTAPTSAPAPSTTPTTPEASPTTTPSTSTPTRTTTTPTSTPVRPTTTTSSTRPSPVPLPAGSVAADVNAFKSAWNAAVTTGVPMITSWDQMPFGGDTASIANLGGNLRLVLASNTADGPVSAAILAWLPLPDAGQQSTQNTIYRDSFAVLMKTVNPSVKPDQQTAVAGQLGLTTSAPPFPAGTSANAELAPQRYDREAIQPQGQSGVVTLIAATQAS